MKILFAMLGLGLLFATNAFAGPKYPMKLIWDNEISQTERENYLSKPILKSELQSAYDGWVESRCYAMKDYKPCLENPPRPPMASVFDAIFVATPDLNNDGKRDLILYMSSETGLSGNGNCGIMEVWFYENTGDDYRNIGKQEFLHSDFFFLGKPKGRRQFRDIITKDYDGFCRGEKQPKFINYEYDSKKRLYFNSTIENH